MCVCVDGVDGQVKRCSVSCIPLVWSLTTDEEMEEDEGDDDDDDDDEDGDYDPDEEDELAAMINNSFGKPMSRRVVVRTFMHAVRSGSSGDRERPPPVPVLSLDGPAPGPDSKETMAENRALYNHSLLGA